MGCYTAWHLPYPFNSASRKSCEVRVLQFSSLHKFKDIIPPSKAFLGGSISSSLAQVLQQSSLGLFQSSTWMRGGKAKVKAIFQFNVQRGPRPESSGGSLAKMLYLHTCTASHQVGVAASSTDSRKDVGDGIPDVLLSTTSSTASSVVQVGTLSKVLCQWRRNISNRFVLNMIKGHHVQLRYHPPLCHNFKWFNIKAATAHYPVIQKEVDDLLAKGVTEPSTGGAGIPKCICGSIAYW